MDGTKPTLIAMFMRSGSLIAPSHSRTWRSFSPARLDRCAVECYAGRMFWFTRKKFVGSYFFLIAAKRS
jgi:hypothetical protein